MIGFKHAATPLVVGALLLTACPGDDTPADTDMGTTGEDTTTDTPDPDTTTGVDPDTGSDTMVDPTGVGPMCEPACEADECCVEGLCFPAPEPTCNPECADTEMCVFPDGADACNAEAMCVTCGTNDPGYEDCLQNACPDGEVCVLDDPANPTFGFCAPQGCGDDACACPLPPGGEALNACGGFDGDDGGGSCYLDCSDGETCPDGMICRPLDGQSACVWPGEGLESDCCFPNGTPGCDDMTCQDDVCAQDAFCCDTEWDQLCVDATASLCQGLCPGQDPPQPLWGDCINVGPCDASVGLQCLGNGEFGWCTEVGCMDDMDCQPPPPTGDAPASCAAFDDGMGGTFDACALLCDMGQTCPDGMDCFMDAFCVWNPIVEGFENCGVLGLDCPMGTVCVDDDMGAGATWAYCSQDMCMAAADCAFDPPPGGDAPVTCADPAGMGGANTCYLDCSGGQTCPTGMACTDSSFCAWPQGMTLFADDFETGDFSMGWTLNDVDGQMPNMNVAFVNDAWVVGEGDGAGVNFSAISTSWYEPVGQSDDWLISPQIMLGAGSRLYWQSRTVDPSFPDGYEVRISTAGTAVADFMANAELFSVMADGTEYGFHFIDLAAAGYTNQNVHLAWRNVTNDGFLLLVDNVTVVDVP